MLFQLSWLSDAGHSGNMVEYIYRLFFSDKKKKGLSFLGGIILKTWHWSPHHVRLLCLIRNVVELFFLFFSSFFDERNVVELTKQTRQRIESKDLKTLCENEKTLYIFFFNYFPQFYFTTILLMIL